MTIGKNITTIGDSAFSNCSIESVNISDLSAWCKIYFASSSSNPLYYASNIYLNGELVTDLIIPNDITEIKQYTFSGCSSLASVTIPNSVTSVGDSAFVSLTVLEEASFPSATTVNANAFTDAVIPVLKLTYPGKITVTGSFAAAGSFQPADTVLYLDESNSSEISDGNTWQSVSWKEIRTVSGETP